MNRRRVVNGQVFIWTRRGWGMVLNGYIDVRRWFGRTRRVWVWLEFECPGTEHERNFLKLVIKD